MPHLHDEQNSDSEESTSISNDHHLQQKQQQQQQQSSSHYHLHHHDSPKIRSRKQPITPSPYAPASSSSSSSLCLSPHKTKQNNGPVVSIYANQRLFPSPIRPKRASSLSSTSSTSESPTMMNPTNLQYITPNINGTLSNDSTMSKNDWSTPKKNQPIVSISSTKKEKRCPPDDIEVQALVKKARIPKDESRQASFAEDGRKKTLISPTSSNEKEEYGQHHQHHHHPYPPPHPPPPHCYPPPPPHVYMHHHHPPPPYPPRYVYGQPPPPYPYYPPPPPPPHYAYPPYPYRGEQREAPPTSSGSPPPPSTYTTPKSKSSRHSSGMESSSWQSSPATEGTAPNANRCVPLKQPVPSKHWGEAEINVALPDFHRLVNYPDYLAKPREGSPTSNGKKHCVMCGKLRVCSATGRNGGSGDDSNIIIPRQNKGLCTECDVTVWVVVKQQVEIKWCKGCKNFRSWAAFGDKGLATKCLKCRDRQREKYALQKEDLRLRRHTEQAAKGLQHLRRHG